MSVLSTFQGMFLPPGMGLEAYSTDVDFASVVWGPLHSVILAPTKDSFIGSGALDAGNTNNTSVLRGGLVMAISTADGMWYPYATGGANGLGTAKGILLWSGLNMALGGAGNTRQMGAIMVKGNIQAQAVCIAASSTQGLATTGVGLNVRTDLLYNISFDDDFSAQAPRPNPIQDAAQQALSGAGAITANQYLTLWTTTGAGQAGSLVAGSFVGQLKKVQMIVDGGDGILTPTGLVGGTTITFSNIGDMVVLRWNGTGWRVIERSNATNGAATTPVVA